MNAGNRKSDDYKAVIKLLRDKREQLVREATLADTRAASDLVVLKETEVRPDCWFPVLERYIDYDSQSPEPTAAETSTRHVFQLKVDEPIADESIFTQKIPDDAKSVQEVGPPRGWKSERK